MGLNVNILAELKDGRRLRAVFSSKDNQSDIDAEATPFGLSEEEFRDIKHIDELFEYIAQWFKANLFVDDINILDYKFTTTDEQIAALRALDFAEVRSVQAVSVVSFPWGVRPWEALEKYNYETGEYISDWDENPNEAF